RLRTAQLSGIAARPSTAIARRPMTSRSASGEGESLKALMIHCSFGMTTSRARIAAPISQFMTMRIRSTTYAIGSAADDEAGLDMIHYLLVYRMSINYLSTVVKHA